MFSAGLMHQWVVAGMVSAAALATRAFRSDRVPEEELPEDPPLEEGADQVQEVLNRPETLALLQRFDERFDATLAG